MVYRFVTIVSYVFSFVLFADCGVYPQRRFDTMQRRISSFFSHDPDDPFFWIIVAILAVALCMLVADVAVWFLL